MSADNIKDYFLEKLEKQDFSGIEGAHLKFHIPVQETFLNFVLDTMIAAPEQMNDFKEIHFSDMKDSEFRVKIDHKMIDREIHCKIHDSEYLGSERKIVIEFLNGIRFYEKALLNFFGKAKSGWSLFKNALKSGEEDESGEFLKISGSKVKIDLNALLRKQDLAFLIPLVDLKGITTKNNSIVIDFEINANQHESNYPTNN